MGRPQRVGEAGLASGRANGVGDASRRRRRHGRLRGVAWRASKWSGVRVARPRVQLWCPGGKPGADSLNPWRISVGADVRYAMRKRGERDAVSGILVIRPKFKINLSTQFFSLIFASNEKLLNTIFVQFFEIYNFHFRHFSFEQRFVI